MDKTNNFEKSVNLESMYDLLTGSSSIGVTKHRLDDYITFIWANDEFYEIFGYDETEYRASFHNHTSEYFTNDPEDWEIIVKAVNDTIASGQNRFAKIVRMRHKDGRRLWIRLISNITEEIIDGKPVAYSIMMDVTSQMQPLFEQSVAYESLPVGIAKYRISKNGFSFIDSNDNYKEMFGSESAFDKLISLDDLSAEALLDGHQEMLFEKDIDIILHPTSESGEKRYIKVSGKTVDTIDHDPVYLFVCIDITESTNKQLLLEKANQELEFLAYIDPVTGGSNSNKLEVEVEKAIENSPNGSYCVVWMNLQKFKLINDLAGSEEGNRTLKHIYRCIYNNITDGEFVARMNSDNFAILLHSQENDKMRKRIESIVDDINKFNTKLIRKYFLTFTAGIYRINDRTLPLTKIQDRANVARKSATVQKKNGLCTCSFYDDFLRVEMQREKELEDNMRDALKNDEFKVYFQPKVSLEDNSIVGAEALVRWHTKDNEILMPGAFIPIFEKNGFIVDLDLHIFRKVCSLISNWIKLGEKPIPVSVNMSRMHLRSPNPIDVYENILKEFRLPANLLEIELTESITLDSADLIVNAINEIHNKGFRCSIDDFGSGYSSLHMLKTIEADTLKLDRGFIDSQNPQNARDEAIVSAIAELAKKLGMSTIAEGIETKPQLDFIRNSGYDQVQGYIFSKALPVDEFENLLRENKRYIVE